MKKNWKQSVVLLMMSFIICIGIVAVPKAVFADTNDIYWGLDNNNKLWISNSPLTDAQKAFKSGEGMWPHGGSINNNYDIDMEYVTEVEFINKVILPQNAWGMFYRFKSCKQIKNLGYMDISNLTSLSCAFQDCESLTTLDATSLNVTSKITRMWCTFDGCKSLKTIDISKFDTSKVHDMGGLFAGCSSLTSLDVSKLNTSSAIGMGSMFSGCESLTSLDVSKLDTSKATTIGSMFSGCKKLKTINVSNFKTENAESMGGMFNECESLTSLDLSNFNTENVTDMYQMFEGCTSLKSVDLSSFNTQKVERMQYMFRDCKSLRNLNLSNFNTPTLRGLRSMFYGCESLQSLNLGNIQTSYVEDFWATFYGCKSLQSLDVSKFDTKRATDMQYMFRDCQSLTSIDLKNFSTSNVKAMSYMFDSCTSLESLDLSSFTVSSDCRTSSMLYVDSYTEVANLNELTVSNSLNAKLSETGLSGASNNRRVWFVKNPGEVSGEYDENGYDRTQISEMQTLTLTGDKITYFAAERDNTSPVITASDKTVEFGTALTAAIKDFKATDQEDGVLPISVKDGGGYNPQKAGTYLVTLSATDSKGSEKTKKVNITVLAEAANAEPAVDKKIKTGGEEPKGATFRLLQAKSTKVTNNSVTLTWTKVPKAAKYVVYGNKCGAKNKYLKLTTTKKQTITYKKILKANVKKGTYYKFVVVAFDKNNKAISTSKTVHVATKGGKVGNDKKVTTAAKKNKVSLKKGKTFKLKAKPIVQSRKLKVKRHRKMAYETSNNKVAIVTGGKIKAIGKGSCYIYAYTQNGVCAKVKVIVK